MRLGLVIEHFRPDVGGAEAYAAAVMQGLAERGHEILVVAEDGEARGDVALKCGALAEAPELFAEFAPELVIDWGLHVPADVHRLGGGTHREFLRLSLEARRGFARVLKRLELAVCPKHRRVTASERELLARPQAHLVAVSEFVAQQVRNTLDVPAHRLRVLHNGVDAVRFGPDRLAPMRAQGRRELGLQDADVAFLFVAHNLGLKNFALLARIFPQVRAAAPAARLVLLGRRRPRLAAPWFVYAGASTEPERCYAAADVLLHPTFYDACANVVLEALAAGLPVVSSDCNGSAELIRDGRNGFVEPVTPVSPETDARWTERILELCRDRELRTRVGGEARAAAEAHSLRRYIDEFETYLLLVLSQRKG